MPENATQTTPSKFVQRTHLLLLGHCVFVSIWLLGLWFVNDGIGEWPETFNPHDLPLHLILAHRFTIAVWLPLSVPFCFFGCWTSRQMAKGNRPSTSLVACCMASSLLFLAITGSGLVLWTAGIYQTGTFSFREETFDIVVARLVAGLLLFAPLVLLVLAFRQQPNPIESA